MSTSRDRSSPVTPQGDRGGSRRVAFRAPSATQWVAGLSVVFLALFLALTYLVVSGAAQPLDERLVERVRPGDVWGESQVRYSPWMHWLSPTRMYVLLACTCAVLAAWRRSWRPLVVGLVLASVSVAGVLLVKFAVERPDPHGAITSTGGSYPSGHMVAVLVCLGGCLLVIAPRVRWWGWALPTAGAGLMTAALVISAAHWPSDVLGGALLALAVLAGVGRWAGPARSP